MSSLREPAPGRLSTAHRRVVWLLLGMVLFGFTGCSGCRQETPEQQAAREAAEAEQKKKEEEERKKREAEEKERKKPDFEIGELVAKPSETEVVRSLVKPGHWMTATQQMKANHYDWGGELSLRVIDNQQQPYPIEKTPFLLASSRPVTLEKGKGRHVESVFLVPQATKFLNVDSRLRERNHGAEKHRDMAPLTVMQPYQYFFVVLAKEPERYAFVKSLNGVLVPNDEASDFDSPDVLHYQVLLPDITKQVPLPDNPLCWTTIAYILWDEVDPNQLDRQRREALVDWLHWGGQLIISGPDSLALLKDSFLAPYLPASDGGATEFAPNAEEIQQLASYWTPRRGNVRQLKPVKPWSGIKLELAEGVSADEGLAASTGGLMVERQVGRGRIVVSAMQIAERDLLTWSPHYDDLFNAGVMRLKPRKWQMGPNGFGRQFLHAERVGAPGHIRDAAYVTHLRHFSRDVHADPNATNARRKELALDDDEDFYAFGDDTLPPVLSFEDPEVVGGIGAWNDFNATSNAAREALRKAAGVTVPDSSFVVLCLGVYLVVLVPLNWLFFKGLGRVEYAWVAAPVIALIGTAIVVKQAQLDIGFVRAQTEISILELQGSHPRAHLSRYTALYTSLSTTYDATFEEPTALAAPFPTRADFQMLPGQRRSTVELTQSGEVKLAGLQVSSATTDMIHSEQYYTLKGPLVYRSSAPGVWQVSNQLDFPLRSVAVVERRADGIYGAWIGGLGSGETKPVQFVAMDESAFTEDRVKEQAELELADQLELEPLFRLALDEAHIEVGETRLVGRVDEVLPGVTITPKAAQVRGASLVVAHLGYAPLEAPQRDVNNPMDIVKQDPP